MNKWVVYFSFMLYIGGNYGDKKIEWYVCSYCCIDCEYFSSD